MPRRSPFELDEIIRLMNRLIGTDYPSNQEREVLWQRRTIADNSYENAITSINSEGIQLDPTVRRQWEIERRRQWNLYSEILNIICLYYTFPEEENPCRFRDQQPVPQNRGNSRRRI